jgi:outer membrane receptor protein involved in Fe transport
MIKTKFYLSLRTLRETAKATFSRMDKPSVTVLGTAAILTSGVVVAVHAETTTLPAVQVDAPKEKPRPVPTSKPVQRQAAPAHPTPRVAVHRAAPVVRQATSRTIAPHQGAPGSQTDVLAGASEAGVLVAAQAALDRKMKVLDKSRESLLPKIGASSFTINRENIETLPQGDNAPIDKVILQAPGVSADSAVSNPSFHVRNEYANVQYRINGIVLPEGISGLGPVLDTNFVGSLSLLTGTLPAQYGLRTAGVIDITSRTFSAPGGNVSVYGGSRETITPSFDYGGAVGDTQYFVTARGNWNALGIENPTSSFDAAHDHTQQGKYFAYLSTLIGDSTRLSLFSGASSSNFQIPNNPGQTPLGDFGPTVYPSSALNENEYDRYIYNIAALQTKGDKFDAQIAVFQRYANVHFVPDVVGDLVFNDVASNVTRESSLYGVQSDASYHFSEEHTLRAGFAIAGERTNVTNGSTVLPVDPVSGAITPTPFLITDFNSRLGWNIGGYVQHEWKINDKLTLNTGVRFDQLYQFVDANQLSPRFGFVYKPIDDTSVHAGYARYFTPPMQAQATPTNLALFNNTTNKPDVPFEGLLKPERADYFDVGVDQKLLPGLLVGVDLYSKIAWNQIDDGQFGQAVVLTQFNYARGYSNGVEFKSAYQNGDFKAYGNFSAGIAKAKDAISNQYLLDSTEYVYLLNNYHNTDDSQFMTASAGASYRWEKTLFTANMTYGSGLRSGFVNQDHVPPYLAVNIGTSREFQLVSGDKPLTVRFDIVNLFDRKYELRDGSGIGVFAPQYGARRGFFVGISQKL